MSNVLYLSQATVRDNTTIPLEDLVRDFRELARQFPLPPPENPGDDWTQTIQKAKDILTALPRSPELYWHGENKQACPCASCAGAGTRLLASGIDEYFAFKGTRSRSLRRAS